MVTFLAIYLLKQAHKMLPRSTNSVTLCVALVAEFFAWL